MFFKRFVLVLTNLLFGRDTGHCVIILWGLETFLVFPNFLRSYVWNLRQIVRKLIYTTFLLIIILWFTFGESKFCSIIKKFMKMIVAFTFYFLFCMSFFFQLHKNSTTNFGWLIYIPIFKYAPISTLQLSYYIFIEKELLSFHEHFLCS